MTPSGDEQGRRRPLPIDTLLAVACGGAVGAVARYLISVDLPSHSGRFPWGTFLVNESGSALLGFVMVTLLERFARHRIVRPLLATGFVGAYTTFSTLVVETVLLGRAGTPATAIVYVVVSMVAGLAALWIGMSAARGVLALERRMAER